MKAPKKTQPKSKPGKNAGIYSDTDRTITIQPEPTAFFIPPWTEGDKEFKGHGPNFYVRVGLKIQNTSELAAEVYVRARETQSDWTTAEGTQTYVIYRHPTPLIEIMSPSVSDHRYTDTNHDMDVFAFPPGVVFSRLECVGDTKGSEAGTRTGVQVFFHPVTLLARTA